MAKNRLQELHDAGQSIWLDSIDRRMLRDGELERRIRDDALTGMTSNPTIFQKALARATRTTSRSSPPKRTVSRAGAVRARRDDRRARRVRPFAGVYSSTRGADGYVSIEVSPGVSHDADATIEEARRLWKTVDRPNVMVKVPGTVEGAVAVRRLIAEGINVNITLLFAIEAHERVIEAYMAGLEDRVKAHKPIDGLASVASFFVSRVDTEIDKRLDALIAKASPAGKGAPQAAQGRAAIANAKLAYRLFRQKFAGPRWEALAKQGARVQRPLWASTSTKNPGLPRRHVRRGADRPGHRQHDAAGDDRRVPRSRRRRHERSTRKSPPPKALLKEIEAVGISMKEVTDKLLVDGHRELPEIVRRADRRPRNEDRITRTWREVTGIYTPRTKIVCTLGPSTSTETRFAG